MRRGEVRVALGAPPPRERRPLHKRLQRRWNRLSRLQRAVLYGALFLSLLTSVHYYVNQDAPAESATPHEPAAPAEHAEHAANETAARDKRLVAGQRAEGLVELVEAAPAPGAGAPLVFTGPTNSRQAAVVAAFQHAWRGYRRLAWGRDNLRPVSGTSSDWFALGLTIVDAMDTAYIMGLHEEYEQARQWVRDELVFTRNKDVNLFEVTIRVLGALLANFHLAGDPMFLDKAKDLGSRLLSAFSSPSGVPYSDVNLGMRTAHAPEWSHYSSTAEVATLQLEFRDLSRLTGDPAYEEAAAAVSRRLHELPKRHGLVPIFISPATGRFLPHAAVTLGARGDSYYEYLLKQWLQTGQCVDYLDEDYREAIDGVQQVLVRSSTPSQLLFVGELAAGSEAFTAKMDHLSCFLPGVLALGAAHGQPAAHLALATALLDTCYRTYQLHPTFLAPEITHFNMDAAAGEDMFVKSADAHSLLRPEFVESLFVMWQLTGNTTYQQWGWQVFQAIEKHARVENGYASVADVRREPVTHRDLMESFFLAETLKYLYLLLADDRHLLDLSKFVLNSEAHPLPIRDH